MEDGIKLIIHQRKRCAGKSIPAADIPQLTTAQMVEVDRLMIEEWHISLVQMMENAGRNFAELARHLQGGCVQEERSR